MFLSLCFHPFSSALPQPVPLSDREVISRLRNCVVALVTEKLMLFDTSILYCYEASLPHQVQSQCCSWVPCCGEGVEGPHLWLLQLLSQVVGLLLGFPACPA